MLFSLNHLRHNKQNKKLPKLKPENYAPPSDGTDNINDHKSTVNDQVFKLNQESNFNQPDYDSMEMYQEYPFTLNNINSGKLSFATFNISYPQVDDRENATFFSLVRNNDFPGMIKTIESIESRFNQFYHYDWVFANNEEFTDQFKHYISNLVSGQVHFVTIPSYYWQYPEWIDLEKANRTQHFMKQNNVKYGGSESYRHMCRFNAGLFYHLPIMQNYRYYWRVEPDTEFQCDIFHTDWFKYMRENNKKYAFTLAPLELHTTVTNFWKTVKQFQTENPQLIAKDNNMLFLTEDDGDTYNMCHFWSNFEIGDMNFFRLESYSKFFDFIDKSGGIYYSRWGDAPIHSVAVSLLLLKYELLYLENTGYYHPPSGDCPRDPNLRIYRRCTCKPNEDSTWSKSSCIPKFFEIHNFPKPDYAPKFGFVNQHEYHEDEDQDQFNDW